MRPLAYAVFTWCALFVMCCAYPLTDEPEPPAWADTGALGLVASCPSGTVKHASAVTTGPLRAYTAAHAVPCGGHALVELTGADGSRYHAKVAYYDEHRDIAELVVQDHPLPGPYPMIDLPRRGDRVCIAAARPKRDWQCGKIEVLDTIMFHHTAQTEFGNSGSGIYDARGRVVGIVTHKFPAVVGGGGRGGRIR